MTYDVVIYSGARDLLDAGFKCFFGAESSQMSLLYVLLYGSAAGGYGAISGSEENSGQEFKIKVNFWL